MNKRAILMAFSGALVLFLSIGALLARTAPKDNSYTYLTIFSNVVHLVDANYVESVDFHKVMDSALRGMVENVDPDASLIPGNDLEVFKKEVEEAKSKAGVGLTLSRRMGMVLVVAVEKGSSAGENKIKPGDFIRSIDGEYVQSMPLYHIDRLLKGDPGTQVKISIFRSAMEKPVDFVLSRKSTRKPYTENYVAQQNIGYIAIHHLLPGVEVETARKLEQYSGQGIKSLILDVRGCTEEDQDLAARVADLFIGATPIVQIANRDGIAQTIVGDEKISYQGKLLVLTDFTTAGGAEIIAGAIQDSGAGKVFGIRTYGRGGIQKLVPAGDNWLVLTTQKYLTPKGRTIMTNGIEPTIPYKEDVKAIEPDDDSDRLLQKAIEYFRYPEKKAA